MSPPSERARFTHSPAATLRRFGLIAAGLAIAGLWSSPASAKRKLGETCNVIQKCGPGLSCQPGIPQRCYHSPRRLNEPCSAGFSCGPGLRCEAGSQKCRAAGNVGDPCHATRPCRSGLHCEAGSHTCRAPGGVGDPCHATRPCGSGLSCQPGVHKCYHSPRRVMEPCVAGHGCADGLSCLPGHHICRPRELDLDSRALCNSVKSAHVAPIARAVGKTVALGAGTAFSVPAPSALYPRGSAGAQYLRAYVEQLGATSAETGTYYGPNGRYGCYATVCAGASSDVSISTYAAKAWYDDFAAVEGISRVIQGGVSLPGTEVLGASIAGVMSPDGERLGVATALSVGSGIAPVDVSVMTCSTRVIAGDQPLSDLDTTGLVKNILGHWFQTAANQESASDSGLIRLAPNIKASNSRHGYGRPSWAMQGNRVVLSGLLQKKRGNWGWLGTLPEQVRPDRRLVFDANTHGGRVRVDVQPDGVITVLPAGGARIDSGWISLGGISYTRVAPRPLPLVGGAAPLADPQFGAPAFSIDGDLVTLSGLVIDPDGGWGHVATLPAGVRPRRTHIFNANVHGHNVRVDVQAGGRVVVHRVTAPAFGWVSLAGIAFARGAGTALPMTSGKRGLGGAYQNPTYTREGDVVHLAGGMVTTGGWGHIATLPAGFRPPQQLVFLGSHHLDTFRIDVLPDGRVLVNPAGGRSATQWISLANIAFYSPR